MASDEDLKADKGKEDPKMNNPMMALCVDGLGPGLSQYRYDLNDLNGSEENQITKGSKFLEKLINPSKASAAEQDPSSDEGASNKLYDYLFI